MVRPGLGISLRPERIPRHSIKSSSRKRSRWYWCTVSIATDAEIPSLELMLGGRLSVRMPRIFGTYLYIHGTRPNNYHRHLPSY